MHDTGPGHDVTTGVVRALLCPDSFKGTVPAAAAASALETGWRQVRPDDGIRTMPLADGGEGTLTALAAAVPGAVLHPVPDVLGPDGQAVEGAWLELPDGTAVVELARVSGMELMRAPDPLGAHTFGLGQVLAAVFAQVALGVVREVAVALGGSASTDGGAGALVALGAALADSDGYPVPLGGGALVGVHSVDLAAVHAPVPVKVWCDVRTPLLGEGGAAAVFAPQKGADPGQVRVLAAGLEHWHTLLGGDAHAPGSGAAGGTAYGLARALGAQVVPGLGEVARLVGLEAAVAACDVVVTGEGRLDATSWRGKVVGGVAEAAGRHGVRVVVVAGQVSDDDVIVAADDPAEAGAGGPEPEIDLVELAELMGSAAAAMARPVEALVRAGAEAAGTVPAVVATG